MYDTYIRCRHSVLLLNFAPEVTNLFFYHIQHFSFCTFGQILKSLGHFGCVVQNYHNRCRHNVVVISRKVPTQRRGKLCKVTTVAIMTSLCHCVKVILACSSMVPPVRLSTVIDGNLEANDDTVFKYWLASGHVAS